MLKSRIAGPPVNNVVLGQNATLTLESIWRYHALVLIVTIAKTAATAGFASATPSDAVGLIDIKVNTKSRRQHTAAELDAVQTAWAANLGITQIDHVMNDLVTPADTNGADTVVGANTTRTSTFVITCSFAEPSRDSYTAREAFAWPTFWQSGKKAKVEAVIGIPANDGITAPVMRTEIVVDNVYGPTANGKDVMPIVCWIRDTQDYAATLIRMRNWPFEGRLAQVSVFSPAMDDVATFELKGDTTIWAHGSKTSNDIINQNYQWNAAGVGRDRFDLALDFDDDPTNWLNTGAYTTLELALTLTQAAAANKSLVVMSQVYLDAIA
jgi:hypothetical protein